MRSPAVFLFIALTFIACNEGNRPTSATTSTIIVDSNADKQEITTLVRQMLNWKEAKGQFDLTPAIEDNKSKTYIGLDLDKHQQNLKTLQESGLFAQEFIDNYDKLIRTLDKKIRNKEFGTWQVGDLPSFRFANDVSPWCNCQDVPYDNPNPWDQVEITVMELSNDKATLSWTWGKSDWSKNFVYKVRAVKEHGKWRIAWLEGFDFDEGIKKDGI